MTTLEEPSEFTQCKIQLVRGFAKKPLKTENEKTCLTKMHFCQASLFIFGRSYFVWAFSDTLLTVLHCCVPQMEWGYAKGEELWNEKE